MFTNLNSFWAGFMTFISVIAGIIVAIIIILYTIIYIYIKLCSPKMQILKGEKVVYETYTPIYEEFKKCLMDMSEDESLKISIREPIYEHPINNLLEVNQCELDDNGLIKLVGFYINKEIYLTICNSLTEKVCIENCLNKYNKFHSTSNQLTAEEYKNLTEKTWWKMEKWKDDKTFNWRCIITRTTLPESKN